MIPDTETATPFKNAMRDWTVLRCEDGTAIVVPENATKLDGLLALLVDGYGGEPFPAENPAIQSALSGTRQEVWHYCSVKMREAEGIEEVDGDWYAADGDGKRRIRVVWYPSSVYDLGDRAQDAVACADIRAALDGVVS